MSNNAEIESRLDHLTTEILLPLRASKELNEARIEDLSRLVDDLILDLNGAPQISTTLAGKLWFVFTQMLSEADHSSARERILDAAWRYEGQLERIFGPFYSSAPPTPGVPRY
ncbi:hypothetical protein ACW14X_09180 [Nocardioides sp. YJ-D4]